MDNGYDIFAPVEGTFLSGYEDMRSGGSRAHHAGDIATTPGTPVVAPADMELIARGKGGRNLRPNDYWAWFRDVRTGMEYRFAHHSGQVMQMEPGTIVKAGQAWDTVGGLVDHPHLHFQMFDPEKNESINWAQAFKKGDRVGGGMAQTPRQEAPAASQGEFAGIPIADPGALAMPGLTAMQPQNMPQAQTSKQAMQRADDAPGFTIPGNNISSRQNNMGNIKFSGRQGEQKGKRDFAIYATPEDGAIALMNLIERYKGKPGLTLAQFGGKYAPSNENPTKEWVQTVGRLAGKYGPDTPLADIPTPALASAIAKRESSTVVSPGYLERLWNFLMPGQAEAAEMPETSRGGPDIRAGFDPSKYSVGKPKEETPQEATPQDGIRPGFDPAKYSLAPKESGWWEKSEPFVRPVLEYGGMIGGGLLGGAGGAGAAAVTGPAAIPTGSLTVPAGVLAGESLGYAGGKAAADYLYGKGKPTLKEQAIETGKDIGVGALQSMGGQALGVALPAVGKVAGKVIRPWWSKLSGVGGARPLELAQEASTAFRDAMTKKMTGEEIVEHAHAGVEFMREQRNINYEELFQVLKQNQTDPVTGQLREIDMTPINGKLRDLMRDFNVKVMPDGTLDVSRAKMGKKGQDDIKEMIERVWDWGRHPEDKTIDGLDGLKRQIDEFYSPSSQARKFTTQLKKTISKTISDVEPGYAVMSKNYSEATDLIKDIESNLMLRKEGMSGRITPDQTLRRLSSAMKDNFEMRRQLVQMLAEKGNQPDLERQIAGHAMSAIAPKGLAGATVSAAELGLMLGKIISPKFWPVLLASSPRAQGEFLYLMGKGLKETKGMEVPVGKLVSYLAMTRKEANTDNRIMSGPDGQ